MPGKKILWLCSWYPDKTAPFNGDFIQRHAQAASLYNDIHVIHVAADVSGRIKGIQTAFHQQKNLTERTLRFSKTKTFYGRFRGHMKLLDLFRSSAEKYIEENGKPDLVHVHVPVWAGITALELKKKYNIPFLVTEHWGIYNDVEVNNYNTKSIRFRAKTKKILEEASVFTSESRFLAEGVNKMVIKKEYEIVPNAVNTQLFFLRPKSHHSFRFIHVSNMVPLKNAEGILKAFRKFLNEGGSAELVMAGDTDPAIREFAGKLGLSKDVKFKGEIPYRKVAAEMQEADALILFSNIENSPCVIGEALCCGLPVIATSVGGIPELINRENGILIKAGYEDDLVAAMRKMKDEYSIYNKEEIAARAMSRFSYDIIGKMFEDLYSPLAISH
jgi:glycosyltransferase involved in cell wall biosynthesis